MVFAAIRKPVAVAVTTALVSAGAALPAYAMPPRPDPPLHGSQQPPTVQIVKVHEVPGFQWGDAAIGAGVAVAGVSLLGASAGLLRRHRSVKTLGT